MTEYKVGRYVTAMVIITKAMLMVINASTLRQKIFFIISFSFWGDYVDLQVSVFACTPGTRYAQVGTVSLVYGT